MKRVKILLGMVFLLSTMSFADTPVQLSTIGGTNIAEGNVTGVRFPLLYGKTDTVKGVDLHILAIGETNNFTGVQFPLLIAGANIVNNQFVGAGFGIANIHKGQSTGALFGLVNMSNNVKGLQWGAVNISSGRATADIGLVNISQGAAFQLGFFNMTDDLTGVQLGLINMAKTGFLPIFPFINIDGRLF
ncbi:MAG: hypothetical protein KAH04_04295 [Psychrilyobacter sp.]|nr:hypothetical protein [Psychrilyobacter sp.]